MISDVDNPGELHDITNTAKMEQGKYKHNCHLTGAIPAAPDDHGERGFNKEEFKYKDWVDDQGTRSVARKYKKLLKKYILTNECMRSCDAILFHQLRLPICEPESSGIANNEREGYYVKVMDWTAWYSFEWKDNTLYGHVFQNPVIQYFMRFDGVPVQDGVKGRQSGAKYNAMVAKSMSYTSWLLLKWT
jgi:hypothetical protein